MAASTLDPMRDVEESKEQIATGTDSEDSPDLASDDQTPTPAFGSDAPDGGTAAWLCVLGGWCAGFCSFGWLNSVGVFQEYYQTGPLQHYSPSAISWIPSLQIFFMMATGPMIGKIFDTWGPRPLLIGGTFLHVFGLMMASISTEYYQFLLSQGVCSSIGVSAVFQPSINCIPTWFTKKRGAAYGVLATGSSLGGILFPIMLTRMIREVSYGWAERTAAFVILLLLVIAIFTVTSRLPPRPSKLSSEQMLGPFREKGFIFLMMGMFLLTFGIYAPITYMQVDAAAQGMAPNLAQYLVAMYNAGSLFGRLFSGLAADKVGRYNTFVGACALAGLLTLTLWMKAANDAALIAFAVLYGFSSGAYVSLIGAIVAQVSPLPEIGYRTGLVFLTAAVPGLVTSPIAGAILGGSGGWMGLKAFAGSAIIAGTALTFAARMVFTGPKLATVF